LKVLRLFSEAAGAFACAAGQQEEEQDGVGDGAEI
jgi:hypothetical protein